MMAPRLALWIALCAAQQPVHALDWSRPWTPPRDAIRAADHGDEYAWRLFVALNWPADPVARLADPAIPLGAARPAVWETWQNTADVYLEQGTDPGPWSAGRPDASFAPEHRFESLSLQEFRNMRHIVGGVMTPLVDPLASAKRLIEIRMNRVLFEYIREHRLYNVDGQLSAVADGRSVRFPFGAVQVKASWRPITAEQRARYHSITVRLADGTTRLYGLTALNIAAKVLPQWFWASFEHEDNASRPGEGWQLPSRDAFACQGLAPDCNRFPAGIGLEGTVWQHYRLRGTLSTFVDAAGRPRLLASSELEAGLQRTASCITCHARASIGVIDGTTERLPVFDTAADAGTTAAALRRGYVGAPDPDWFDRIEPSGERRRIFQPLDFVWSLSQAKPLPRTAFNTSGDSP